MSTFNPYIVIAVIMLIGAAAYYAISDLKKHLPKKDKTFSLNKNISSGSEVTQNIDNIPIISSKSMFKNYKKYKEEDIVIYSSANFLKKIQIFLRTHLNNNYNLLNETEYLVLTLIGFVIGGAVGFWAMQKLWAVFLVAVIGLMTPEVYLKFQVKQYKEEINKQSILLTQLVIQGMRAGISIGDAFARAGKQLQGPIEKEVDILTDYFRSGFTFQDACRAAKKETASTFLIKIYNVIIMSLDTRISPDDLIERLMIIRKNIIQEYYLKEQMRAEAGGSTLAKNILIFIVPALLLLVLKNSASILVPLVKEPAGWASIAAGIGLYTGGIILSNKVIKKLDA